MKIVFNRQMIVNAVAPLMCAVSGKATLTAVEGILFQAKENGECTMTTFDLEKGMRITVTAQVDEPGEFILNAQKFSQTVRVMDGEEVTLTVTPDLHACIASGKSSHKMNALNAADYPAIPNLTTVDGFLISQALFKQMLAKSMYAMAANDQRPVLNGCYFKLNEEGLLTVSCDSFKLAKCHTAAKIENKNEDGSALNPSFILPNKTVNELFRMLSDDPEKTVRIYMTRKNMIFHFEDMIFFSRLIDGVYIDYDRIINTSHRIRIVLNKEEFVSALERAALVTEEKVAGSVRAHVRLELEGNILKISATSTLGSTYDEVEVENESGESITIAFNNRFLIDSLRACTAEKAAISMTSPLMSINIEPAEKEEGVEELFMLLPVRMKD